MRIILTSPTTLEIKPLLGSFGIDDLSVGKLINVKDGSVDMDILISGIGMLSTAYYLGKMLNRSYNMAFQLGIAGSFSKDYPPGSVLHVSSDCIAELGVEEKDHFIPAAEMNIGIYPELLFEKSWLHNRNVANIQAVLNLKQVKSITVNTVHGQQASVNKLKKLYDPVLETMEGAAFLFACKDLDIACAQIRTVSNYVKRRDLQEWDMKLAVKTLSDFANMMLDEIKQQ